jgi:hypothetical protein
VNVWKIILATLVIYSAGLLMGGLLVKQTQPPRPVPRSFEPPVPGPEFVRQPKIFLERLDREVHLTPEQRRRLEIIFQESHERTRILMSLINPEMQAEFKDVREKIKAELRPDQWVRFEQLMRLRPRFGDMPRDLRPFPRNSDPLAPGPSSIEPPR